MGPAAAGQLPAGAAPRMWVRKSWNGAPHDAKTKRYLCCSTTLGCCLAGAEPPGVLPLTSTSAVPRFWPPSLSQGPSRHSFALGAAALRLAPLPAAQTCCCWLHLRLCCRCRRCGAKLKESACIVSLCATAMFPQHIIVVAQMQRLPFRIALLALDIAGLSPRPSRTVILF